MALKTLNMSQTMWKTQLAILMQDTIEKTIFQFIWKKVKKDVDRFKLGNSTEYQWPFYNVEPSMKKSKTQLKVYGKLIIENDLFLGMKPIQDIINELQKFQTKHGQNQSMILIKLLIQLQEFLQK